MSSSELYNLDLDLGWHDGDAERILIVLGVGVSEYGLKEIVVCMNRLGDISNTMVGEVRDILGEWDTAEEHLRNAGHEDNAGKVLVKADVLEWEREGGGKREGILKEKERISYKLGMILSFCPIVVDVSGSQGTRLYRS